MVKQSSQAYYVAMYIELYSAENLKVLYIHLTAPAEDDSMIGEIQNQSVWGLNEVPFQWRHPGYDMVFSCPEQLNSHRGYFFLYRWQ